MICIQQCKREKFRSADAFEGRQVDLKKCRYLRATPDKII